MSTQPTSTGQPIPLPAATVIQSAVDGRQTVPVPSAIALAIPRLAEGIFQFEITPSDFTALTANTLGNLGTSEDGFDELFATPALELDKDIATFPDLAQHLADADFIEGNFESSTWSPIGDDTARFVKDGDAIVDDFNAQVNPGGTNPPPTQPPPGEPPPGQPPGGGGGPGGGPPGPSPGGGGGPIEPPSGCDPTIEGGCPEVPPAL
jgi:hypothetical protein